MGKLPTTDVSNLFQKFGGDETTYKEIQIECVRERSLRAWPLVEAIENQRRNGMIPKTNNASHTSKSLVDLLGLSRPTTNFIK
ncbi:MAG: BcsR/BcsP family cellulose biosynthesis protein [Gallionellaceae bacterium]|jgi:hypothetical protein